jgi:hypothetical protein
MLKSINGLMKFVYAKDVFLCDYITIVKICQAYLYKMYIDPSTSFQPKDLHEFTNFVTNKSYVIT